MTKQCFGVQEAPALVRQLVQLELLGLTRLYVTQVVQCVMHLLIVTCLVVVVSFCSHLRATNEGNKIHGRNNQVTHGGQAQPPVYIRKKHDHDKYASKFGHQIIEELVHDLFHDLWHILEVSEPTAQTVFFCLKFRLLNHFLDHTPAHINRDALLHRQVHVVERCPQQPRKCNHRTQRHACDAQGGETLAFRPAHNAR